MIGLSAANRDPRQFHEPDQFQLERPGVRNHVAFGRGFHACPGAPLARLEARVTLERFLDRTTDIRICEEHHGPANARRYDYVPTYILHGLSALHIQFTQAR
jgi:cytochrome P450